MPVPSDTIVEPSETRHSPPAERPDYAVPRKAWIAAALTIIGIGLGQLYVGRPVRALVVWTLASVGGVALIALALSLRGLAHLAAWALIVVASYALPAVDAARIARATGREFHPRWYNRWYVYAGLVVLVAVTWQPWLRQWLLANVVESFRIPAASMDPTIMAGDYIVTTPWRGDIARGDIVVYRRPSDMQVSRVLGLPGDTIEMRAGKVRVSGRVIEEPYVPLDTTDAGYPELGWQRDHLAPGVDRAGYRPSMRSWGPLVVPVGAYFLLSDNRAVSLDSRLIGFVARGDIVKQPAVIYFSRDRETGTVRWARIGRDLRR